MSNDELKICVLVKSLPIHSLGGLENHTFELATELSKYGCRIFILTFAHPNGLKYEKINENLEIFYLSREYHRYLNSKQFKEYFLKFKELHQKYNFDLIHSQSVVIRYLIAHENLNIPIVTTFHGFWTQGIISRLNRKTLRSFAGAFLFLFKFLTFRMRDYKKILRKSNEIIVIHNELVKQFSEFMPEIKDKINLVYNGINTNQFKPVDATDLKKSLEVESKRIVLYTGRLAQEKGLHDLVEIMPELVKKNPDLHLMIIGTGPFENTLKEMVNKLRLNNNVDFLGFIPNDELYRYLSMADIYVFPSLALEGLPISLIEAMSNSLPIISSRTGGIPTLIRNGKTGLLYHPGDKKALTNHIEKLLSNNELLRKLGTEARKYAISHFSISTMVSKTIDVYKKVMYSEG